MNILGRESKLSRALGRTCTAIASLDAKRDGLPLYRQLVAAKPDLAEKLARMAHASPPSLLAALQQSFGANWVSRIKDIPIFVNELVGRSGSPDTPAALRCAIVAVLAFVAQPRDIIPDDAEGGYGFLDDAAMVGAAMLMVLKARSADTALLIALRDLIETTLGFVPPAERPRMQAEVDAVAQIFQAMSLLPADYAEAAAQQYLDNPELATTPPAPAGWQSPFARSKPAGPVVGPRKILTHGDDLYVPGGPAVVGGRFVLPG